MAGRKSTWTDEDIETLIRLRTVDGLSAMHIGLRMGRSRSSILGQLHRRGISIDGRSSWTEECCVTLRSLREKGYTPGQIARQMGRSVGSVAHKLHALGLSSNGAKVVALPVEPTLPALVRSGPAAPAGLPEAPALGPGPAAALLEPQRAPDDPVEGLLAPPPRPRRPGQLVATVDLREGDCKWPIGEVGERGFGHCGRPTSATGRVYCDQHHEEAYTRRVVPLSAQTRQRPHWR